MDTQSTLQILFLGATGYIGGGILAEFVAQYPKHSYAAIIRNPKDRAALQGINVKVIIGSYDQLDLVQETVSGFDLVVNAADADDLPLAKAVIAGLKARASQQGVRKPILIHTSGTGVLTEKTTGSFDPSYPILDDNNPDDIRKIPDYRPHRYIDLEVIKASEEGVIDTYIVAPSCIYGKGRGPVRNLSQQIPNLIRWAIKHRQAGQIGEGSNRWNNVHIDDLSRLYVLVADFSLSGKNTNNGYSNFFFGCTAEHVWGDIVKGIAKDLHKRGLVDTEEVNNLPPDTPNFPPAVGNNSRGVANRGFSTGWKPVEKSVLEVLPDDIELTISQL